MLCLCTRNEFWLMGMCIVDQNKLLLFWSNFLEIAIACGMNKSLKLVEKKYNSGNP